MSAVGEGDPETGRLLHRLTLAVRWGDMDALGHINNATYFTYFEQARVAWLEGLAGGAEGLTAGTASGPVVVTAACEFRAPVTYPATVVVELYGEPPGRSSFGTRYRLTDAGDGRIYALGSARVVWVDHRAGRSMALPQAVREALPAGG